MQLGFSTLRELAILRPSVRRPALDVLLGLTTHAGKEERLAHRLVLIDTDARSFIPRR